MTSTMRERKEAIEKLLKSGEYLIRGVREGSLVLGESGGIWATDSIELAKTFGDKLELIPGPRTSLRHTGKKCSRKWPVPSAPTEGFMWALIAGLSRFATVNNKGLYSTERVNENETLP